VSYIVLACTGLDKPEGSVTREIALRLAEEAGAEIVCPVSLNRTPARYTRALAEGSVVVIDGCATQCASKLATAAGAKAAKKTIVSEVVKELGATLPSELRLGSGALELARQIAERISAGLAAEERPEARAAADGGQGLAADGGHEAAASDFQAATAFTVIVLDKYEFRIPLDGYLFNPNDVWVQVAGDRARVGISDYMQQRLTDITYVDPPQVGAEVEQFDECGTVESTKASFEVVSPVSGTVVAVNEALAEMPEAINEDPYGSWIAELELTNWEEDRVLLVDGAAYAAEVERKAAED
jgi:glycine cleavage system H protein